jgi:DNA invertase Pin-like site-specific DNA recombinase
MQAIIYARQSSGREENSLSIGQQISNCEELCREKNWQIKSIFSDHNTSGRTYPFGSESVAENDKVFSHWYVNQQSKKKFRDGLGSVFSSLCHGDVIVVDDLTRLYRSVGCSMLEVHIKQLLGEKDAQVVVCKGISLNVNSFSDNLIATMQNQINDNQLAIQRKKGIASMNALRDSGVLPTGTKALGLSCRHHDQIKVDPDLAEVVRFVMKKVSERGVFNQIVSEVNHRWQHLFPRAFYTSNLYHIIDQPLYCGYMRNSKGELILCKQMQGREIISRQLWEKVQKVRADRRQSPRRAQFRSLPFTGILRCGHCHGKMVTSIDNGRVCYHCQRGVVLLHDKECQKSRINIDASKDQFTGLKKAIAPLLILAQYNDFMRSLQMEKELDRLADYESEYRIMEEKYETLAVCFMNSMVSSNIMEKSLEKARPKLEKLQEKIRKIREYKASDAVIKREADKYWCDFEALLNDNLPDAKYEELLKEAVDHIDSHYDSIEIFLNDGVSVKLDRYMYKNRRQFPKYEWKCLSESHDTPLKIKDCKWEVTYLYPDGRKKRLVVDLPVLKIYESKQQP